MSMTIPDQDLDSVNTVQRRLAQIAFTPAGQWYLRTVAPRVDPTLIRLTRGWTSSIGPSPRFVLVTHTGAKSGIERTTPLIYFTDAGRIILIASNYGGTRHPAWYHNVTANPVVQISAGRGTESFRGEELTGTERDRLWDKVKQTMPGYATYEALAGDRTIPLLAFRPIR
ncbi:nitroreductase family deazaflavin-dependent oxidoreductase [Gordonia sp. SID5947]|uniref:nitroreductase family deazaflavin-dependent oxidoreductase n=1 Tax=Gordonia sp. SID5947 TaxID=2690315 RepID=UPI0013710219|nr:nitroreductase family deazaflavin-dependent oxidoreductase [Gordonia sp. SID5947]MYR08540.1 nitroreductase family deazaflavin-dependent oxidoreductase [Gordonia sp. SID5947]